MKSLRNTRSWREAGCDSVECVCLWAPYQNEHDKAQQETHQYHRVNDGQPVNLGVKGQQHQLTPSMCGSLVEVLPLLIKVSKENAFQRHKHMSTLTTQHVLVLRSIPATSGNKYQEISS